MPLTLTRRPADGGLDAHVHPGSTGIRLDDCEWMGGDDDCLVYLKPIVLPGESSVLWVEFEDVTVHNTRAYVIRAQEVVDGVPKAHFGYLPCGTTDADIPLVTRQVYSGTFTGLGYTIKRAESWTVDATLNVAAMGEYNASDDEPDYALIPVQVDGEHHWVHAWTNGSSLCTGSCICVYSTKLNDDRTVDVHYGEMDLGPFGYMMSSNEPQPLGTHALKTVRAPLYAM